MRHVLREAIDFSVANRILAAWILLAAAISYGFVICNFSLSIDEELHFTYDLTLRWAGQGRWAITLLKLMFGTQLPLPFFQPALAVLVLACAAITWCFTFSYVSGRKLDGSPWLTLFAVLYVTMPCNAYYLSFNTYNTEVSVGLLLTALFGLATFSFAFERAGWPSLAWATVIGMLAIAIYQTFLIVEAAGIAAIVLLHMLSLADGTRMSTGDAFRKLVACAAPLFAGYLCYRIVGALFASKQIYVDFFFNWGKLDNVFIVRWLLGYVLALFRGEGFIGGRIIWPLALLALVAAVVLLWDAVKLRGIVPLLLLLALLGSPFLLSIGLGTPMPNRTQQILPLAYSAIVLVAAMRLGLQRRAPVLLAFATILIITWNGQANTRLFFSEYLSFKRDEAVAHQLVERLIAKGWDGRPVPLVVNPGLSYAPNRYFYKSETIGGSFFDWDLGNRAPPFMNVLGYPFQFATPAQRLAGLSIAKTLPQWPRQGSVAFVNGVAIVNMGPPKPQ